MAGKLGSEPGGCGEQAVGQGASRRRVSSPKARESSPGPAPTKLPPFPLRLSFPFSLLLRL